MAVEKSEGVGKAKGRAIADSADGVINVIGKTGGVEGGGRRV